MTTTERFVDHALSLDPARVPAEAVAAAKTFLLDTIGVGVAGRDAPYVAGVRAAAARWGEGRARILGGGMRLPAASAAFVDAFQIHGQEFDCVHEPAVVHPMAAIGGALFAEIERGGVSGRDFLAAMIAGVDVAATIGVMSPGPIRFFRPANAGGFGAVCGLARLRGFGRDQALDALGVMLGQTAGTMQAHVEGKPTLPMQIAAAARAALGSADLAETGLPGPHDVFDGPFGYFKLFEERADLRPLDDLGRVFRIAQVSHKPWPTGRAAQGGIALIQELRGRGLTPDGLESLTLTAPPLIERLVGRPVVERLAPNYARLCFPYVGALALTTGTVGLRDFAPERLSDAAILELARRIRVVADGSADPAAFAPQIAEARLKDGRVLTARIDALPGSPAAPLTREAHLAKFRACWALGLGPRAQPAAEALIARVEALEDVADMRELLDLAAPD